MDKKIFDLLLIFKDKGTIELLKANESNRDQRIRDAERDKTYNVLKNNGMITYDGNRKFTITEYGYDVAQHDSWKDYLKHEKTIKDIELKKKRI